MKKPKVQFSVTPIIAVKIQGEGHAYVKNDGGLVSRFLKWTLDEDIDTALNGGYAGGGSYLGFYTVEDASRIAKWLEAEGAKASSNL